MVWGLTFCFQEFDSCVAQRVIDKQDVVLLAMEGGCIILSPQVYMCEFTDFFCTRRWLIEGLYSQFPFCICDAVRFQGLCVNVKAINQAQFM